MSAEDEDKKDYMEALQRAYINLNRTDEVGLLAIEYFYIVGILNNKNLEKKLTPKHPSNPFHLGPKDRIDYEHLTEQKTYALVPTLPIAHIGVIIQPQCIFPEPPRNNANFIPIPSEIAKVGWFISLKSQLYLLSA
eukprot:gene37556-45093_t